MYVSRIVYEGCDCFQDANSQGSSLPNSLFNLTQNYYYVVSDNEDLFTTVPANKEDKDKTSC